MQLGHPKLSGYGLLSTQGVQNRSQNCWVVSQSYVMPISLPGGGAKKVGGAEGVKVGEKVIQKPEITQAAESIRSELQILDRPRPDVCERRGFPHLKFGPGDTG